MTPFTDDELIDFVFGRQTERTADIARQAAVDEELAAQLDIMRALSGIPAPSPPITLPVPCRPRTWSRSLRRVAAAVIALLMLGGVSWAAWFVLHTPPLLHDNFNDRWLNLLLWQVPRPTVREEGGYIVLVNRGYLVTEAEYPGPIDLTFRWRWRDLGGWPAFSDTLTVVLRTTGRPLEARPHEVADGIAVQFNAVGGFIGIRRMPLQDGPRMATTPDAAVPLPAGEWHDIRITDDGETIAVYVQGPSITPHRQDEPILQVACPDTSNAHRIALYNRERLADVPHESHVDDFFLRRLHQ